MMVKKTVQMFMLGLSLLAIVACGNGDKDERKTKVESQHNGANLPTIALAKKFVTNNTHKADASDVASITSGPQKLLFAYYTANTNTADGQLRWYISATGGSLAGYVFSLGDIEGINGTEKVSWREVSSNAASVNLVTEQISIGNISDNPSHTFKDWGLGVDKSHESIQEDINLIKNTTVEVKWWFFQAPNDTWYIIDKSNHIYKFGTKNGEYDWEDVNMTSSKIQFYMDNGVKKIKHLDPFVAPKKTGQTISYDQGGNIVADGSLKDDGYYKKGTTPSYTRDDENETVLDNIRGLMWQDDASVASVTKQWLSDANYVTCYTDTTDLACFDTTGDTATTYCSDLVMGGFEDWRLPRSVELEGIVNYGVSNQAIDSIFQNTASDFYWTSTSFVGVEDSAWIVNFINGDVNGNGGKGNNNYVRCVRDGQ